MYTIARDIQGGAPAVIGAPGDPVRAAIDPLLTQEDNDAGQLTFRLCPENPEYDSLRTMVSQILVLSDEEEVWRGRINTQTAEMDRMKSVTVKGILDVLHDSVIHPQTLQGPAWQVVNDLLYCHNASTVEPFKHFQAGTVSGIGDVTCEIKNSRSCWDVLRDLVRQYGGSLSTHRENGENFLDWRAETVSARRIQTQNIAYGKNLLRLSVASSGNSICTVLYGYGKKTGDRTVTIASVNDGKTYLEDTEALAEFGRIEGVFSDPSAETPEDLREKMEAELENRNRRLTEITAEALDLADLGGGCEPLRAGDFVHLSCPGLRLRETVLIRKIDRRLWAPEKTKITLGTTITAASRIMGGKS